MKTDCTLAEIQLTTVNVKPSGTPQDQHIKDAFDILKQFGWLKINL